MDPTASLAARRDAPGMRMELRNGRIADVARGAYYPSGTCLTLRAGRIEAVLPPGSTGGPPPDLVIDLQGRAVVPGLFNTHCHLQMSYPSMLLSLGELLPALRHRQAQIEHNLAECLAHGVTHVRDAFTTDLRPNRRLSERIAAGEIPGPRIHQCVLVSPEGGTFTTPRDIAGRIIAGMIGAGDVPVDRRESAIVAFPAQGNERQVRDAVDRAIDERGARYIKLYDQEEYTPAYAPGAAVMTPAQLAAAADQARRRGVPTTMHHVRSDSLREAVAAGVGSVVHLAWDAPLTAADAQAVRASGAVLEPTVSLLYFLCYNLPGMRWAGHPRAVQLDELRERTHTALVAEYWLPGLQAPAQGHFRKARQGRMKLMGLMNLSSAFYYWGHLILRGVDNLRALRAAGVPITCSNDAGPVPATPAMAQLELELLTLWLNAEDGAPPFCAADALRAATLDSARVLGLDAHLGSLEAGKIADLVVLDGDPLADVRRIGAPVAALFMDGRLVLNPCGLAPTIPADPPR